jgi:ABC-type amino acid transport substrate-binding protein
MDRLSVHIAFDETWWSEDMRSKLLAAMAITILASTAIRTVAAQQVAGKKIDHVVAGLVTGGPPFSYVENGEYKGLTHDIVDAVAKANGIKVEYEPLKFDAIIPALQVHQIDAGIAGFYVTDARKKVVDFSEPFYSEGSVLVVPIDSMIKGYDDLKGKTIAVELGSAASQVAMKLAPSWGATLRVIADAHNMKLAMASGDVDAEIYDSAIIAYQLSLEEKKPTQRIVGDVMSPTDIAVALPKGSEFGPVLNAGIIAMKGNGELKALELKYGMQ